MASILCSPFFKELPEHHPRTVSPFSGINFSENKEDNHPPHPRHHEEAAKPKKQEER